MIMIEEWKLIIHKGMDLKSQDDVTGTDNGPKKSQRLEEIDRSTIV